MTALPDVKKKALQLWLTSTNPCVPDLELAFLRSNLSTDVGGVQDLWKLYFASQGYSEKSIDDNAKDYFKSLGYIGTIDEQWKQYWANLTTLSPQPSAPFLEGVNGIKSATVTKLANGNYRIVAGPDSSGRFFWPVDQLIGGHSYTLKFTVVSLSDPNALGVSYDWNDGTSSGDATTLPATQVTISATGDVTATVKRATYTNTYHFLDISNEGDPEEDSGDITVVITPPVLS